MFGCISHLSSGLWQLIHMAFRNHRRNSFSQHFMDLPYNVFFLFWKKVPLCTGSSSSVAICPNKRTGYSGACFAVWGRSGSWTGVPQRVVRAKITLYRLKWPKSQRLTQQRFLFPLCCKISRDCVTVSWWDGGSSLVLTQCSKGNTPHCSMCEICLCPSGNSIMGVAPTEVL